MTKSIDEWAAEKCGVKLWNDGTIISGPLSGRWSIKREDCREKVREHFKINTLFDNDKYINRDLGYVYSKSPHSANCYFGEDIAEAEIACITAIYESEK